MKTLLDFDGRGALCRELAEREPNNRHLWLAEADKWSRLARAKDSIQAWPSSCEEPNAMEKDPIKGLNTFYSGMHAPV